MNRLAVVPVVFPSARYDVFVGPHALEKAGSLLAPLASGRRVAVITDSVVGPLYADALIQSLEGSGFLVDTFAVEAGEPSKCWDRAGEILEWLARCGLDRTDTVVALGGGVVGDLGGFCAAVYLRGVAFVQVPTTLLAQVDSSIGGKTGVDLVAGKNLAGAFIQPLCVIADTAALATVPHSEWQSGLGEVVKSAVLDSEEFLSWLESHAGELLARTPTAADETVRRCIAFKAGVVGADEREAGVRESLNLGHTLGHAIEREAGYGVVPHGIAVAEGMRFALHLATALGHADPRFRDRVLRLLDLLGLVRLTDIGTPDALRLAMSSDKKARAGVVRFVVPRAPGEHVVEAIDPAVLVNQLDVYVRQGRGTS
ncbi:MAG: 3-dehydroquinate synthase [Actinobacteria bacterium HGW-Actinobacteria-10]|jgi:3-dehydroquinate synthase|nr:MAG: 3-dehydroquinate synthase [Actinobacteria bacterium HGW-Actinobacteria-10]